MRRTCHSIILGLLVLIGLFVSGCGRSYVGKYYGDVRIVEGKHERPEYPLVEAKRKYGRFNESIQLNADGKYIQHAGGRIHEGDWWLEDGKIAIRCRKQNGKRIGKALVSEGADFYFVIDNGDLLRGHYDRAEANLEVVFRKTKPE